MTVGQTNKRVAKGIWEKKRKDVNARRGYKPNEY
jgi:hypothetical protein